MITSNAAIIEDPVLGVSDSLLIIFLLIKCSFRCFIALIFDVSIC